VTRGRLPQRAGSLILNGGGNAAAENGSGSSALVIGNWLWTDTQSLLYIVVDRTTRAICKIWI